MTLYAGFQSSVAYPQVAYQGDFYGLPINNGGKGYIVDPASAGINIGTFCWGLIGTNNTQVTPFKGSNTEIAGFTVRSQSGVWSDSDIIKGYSMTVPATRQIQVFANGSFYAICPSLNSGDVIVAGDIVLLNNTTGALASQTTSVVPSGYTQVAGYIVINASPTNSTITNLVVISNRISF